MRVIFLDIDGVLNDEAWLKGLGIADLGVSLEQGSRRPR